MQNKTYTRKAYAKINLYLDVLGKMENGYHEIESVMQSVSLSDEITLTVGEGDGIEITSNSPCVPLNEKNLVHRAAVKFLSYLKEISDTQIEPKKLSFHIEKNIPVEAGMAGGSTDCAATLYLLNEAFDYPIKDNELLSLGASLGADVAFCLSGGTAVCRGIGEKIAPIECAKEINLVCAIGDKGVSTPYAFGLIDEKFGTTPKPHGKINEVVDALENGNISALSTSLFNRFEAVIEPINDTVSEIKAEMLKNGALGALMSGSGPSVFGIFPDSTVAERAAISLKMKNFRVFVCKTV